MTASPLHRSWRRDTAPLPLRAWRVDQLEAVGAAVRIGIARWRRAWSLELADGGCTCGAAASDEVLDRPWNMLGQREGGRVWIAWPAEIQDRLAGALFAVATASTPVVRAVTAACVMDAAAKLATALALQRAVGTDPVPAVSRWSGLAMCRLPWDGRLLVNAEAVAAHLQADARRPPCLPALACVSEALARTRVALQVRLEGCEIDLATLQGLQRGDIVRTGHALRLPAQVRGPAGGVLFSARLLRSGAFRAVALGPCPAVAPEESLP